MEPRKSTVGLSSRNEDTPTLSPSAHFVINNPVAEEEEEEEGVKVSHRKLFIIVEERVIF